MSDPQPFEKSSKLSKKEIIFNNFLGGIFWALGATVGLALIFTILAYIAKHINFVPVVGSFVSQIIDFVLKNNSHLHG
jgi:Domain of unknown function (DUF5665)